MLVSENQLDVWVRGNARDAQGMIVELVWRLVAASAPNPRERRFPLGDSIGQPGPDGFLYTDLGFNPFVPEGRSFWEIGTGEKAGDKATRDYRELTEATPASVRSESTYIFVTPLSGRKDWPHTWKEDAQASWREERRGRNEWRDVRVIDGTGLVDWLQAFPSVELWLAQKMGFPAQHIETPEQRWALLRTVGDPPPLTPHVFLANRDQACEKLKEVFSRTTIRLKLDTHFPDQIVDFISAYVAAMVEEARVDTVGRCLITSNADAWSAMSALRERHILVADFNLDEAESLGTRLIEKASRAGHAIIYGGMPGGIPHPNRIPLPSPKSYQVKEALQKAGYKEERARILAQKSGGNLSSLLRCLQNLSLMPAWAEGTHAAELAIAELLGSWNEGSEADRAIIEGLRGNPYGEWIGWMREIALRPGTPLTQRDGLWKVVARYEAWHALGPKVFDEHLDRLKKAAVTVFREQDPQFELPTEERSAASLHGKVLTHSRQLRTGLAETLAILGSFPKALTSCSFGKAEATAVLAVREILAGTDWLRWGSLNDLLPLLAEAAPGEFLSAVEKALHDDPCPFDTLFEQEGAGIMGRTYVNGLLWALETLAWDPEHLTRVVVTLGELAARDPGGSWRNRPANSLTTILLPWLPQTCAPVVKRKSAVAALLDELPEVAWKLLLSLLPQSHQASSYTRKPAWRDTIPDDWTEGVTHREYWEQAAIYAEMAIDAAKTDLTKLADLIDRLNDLPPSAHEQVCTNLASEAIVSMPEADRLRLWTELMDLVSKHRKFADAEWAMKPERVNRLAAVAERLAPIAPGLRHRRLFSERDFDLIEETGSYEQQRNALEERRQRAVGEVFASGGVEAVLEFASAVESPWRVGFAFGTIAENDSECAVIPELLEAENKSLTECAGGFVWGRFHARGWHWVDEISTSEWTSAQKGQLLAYLPFVPETWERSTRWLGVDEGPYWTRTTVDPYAAGRDISSAIDRLIEHGRPHAAIRCLQGMRHNKLPLNSHQAIRALLAGLHSKEDPRAMEAHGIAQIIKALQDDPGTNSEDLFRVEWAYLPLLDRHQGAAPKVLEQRLADDPSLFCEVIRIVFRSKNEEGAPEEPTDQQKKIATNAYHLLSGWGTPPGSRKDGTYDGDPLNAWLKQVKTACAESGHLEIAMTMVGHALIHVPPDPDGLWIHRSVAAELNATDADNMRDGFVTELINSRGVHGFTAGGEERGLAAKYRRQADEVESGGYHRLANSLRELAASYERDAERESSRDPFED